MFKRLIRRGTKLAAAVTFGGVAVAGAQGASNLSFESGDLSGWNTAGDTQVLDDSFGHGPTSGDWQGAMFTGDASVDGGVLADFLGVDIADLDALNSIGGDITQGSAIAQDLSLGAGDWVSFDWMYLTNEWFNTDTSNDFAFALLTEAGSGSIVDAIMLADTFSDLTFATPQSGMTLELTDGYQQSTALAPAPSSGLYQLAFGVVDLQNEDFLSAMLVDNVQATVIPLPMAAWAGLVLLTGLATVRVVRHARAQRQAGETEDAWGA